MDLWTWSSRGLQQHITTCVSTSKGSLSVMNVLFIRTHSSDSYERASRWLAQRFACPFRSPWQNTHLWVALSVSGSLSVRFNHIFCVHLGEHWVHLAHKNKVNPFHYLKYLPKMHPPKKRCMKWTQSQNEKPDYMDCPAVSQFLSCQSIHNNGDRPGIGEGAIVRCVLE